jgi:hypothetical protein
MAVRPFFVGVQKEKMYIEGPILLKFESSEKFSIWDS